MAAPAFVGSGTFGEPLAAGKPRRAATFHTGLVVWGAMACLPTKSGAHTDRPEPAANPVGEVLASFARLVMGRHNTRIFWWSWGVEAILVLVINLLDSMSRIHIAEQRNLLEPAWRPITDEYSSGAVVIALFPIVARLAVLATPWDRRGLQFFLVHGPAAAAFSVVHVALFILIRLMVYGLLGELYEFGGLGEFLYELPRDLVVYGLCVGGVWGAMVLLQSLGSSEQPTRAMFDIRDNARILRVPIDDILAVRSAGNYVEFLLADGRRPLMRATLADTAEQLGPHGLARTHRSWLVNKRRIAQIEPAGSGDFKLSLSEGVEAPLSRRFKGAIDQG
jgi:uncharacterized membrane protein YhaH (DUF805 family)